MNLLNLINFRQEHPSLGEFKKAVKNYVSKYISLFGAHKISINFLNDKSLSKLDTILPMVTISDRKESSDIFKQLSATKALDVSLFSALSLPDEEIDDFINKMIAINRESLLTYLPDIFANFYPSELDRYFSKIAQKIGGIDFNMAEAIMKKAEEKNLARTMCMHILNNMKEGEQIPDNLEPYMWAGEFLGIKIIGKDLYNTNSEISNEMALLLNTVRMMDKRYSLFSKASRNALEKMLSKLNSKLKTFDKFSADDAGILKIGPLSIWKFGTFSLLKAVNNQFYHDMVKENEDGLTEEEKQMNQIYKKDFERMNKLL